MGGVGGRLAAWSQLDWGQLHEGGRMSLRQAGVEGGNKERRILISARSVARPAGRGL